MSDSLSTTFAALADPTRRAILARLALGETSVTELAEPFEMSMPAVSRHLRVLEDAGLISAPHTTESLVEGREELGAILEGVQKLPDDRREALIMRFALGMDNREIARALGRSDGATKVLLHRAIRQLEGIVSEGAGTAGSR